MPKSLSVQEGAFDYNATYSRNGNVVMVNRSFKFSPRHTVCSPQDFA